MGNRRAEYKAAGIYGEYFEALNDDLVIDGTLVGNYSSFVNHSCRPIFATEAIVLDESSYQVLSIFHPGKSEGG